MITVYIAKALVLVVLFCIVHVEQKRRRAK